MEGLLTIEEFKDFFDIEDDLPDEDEDLYKTLGGLITYGVGRIPRETDTYEWEKLSLLKSWIWTTCGSIRYW